MMASPMDRRQLFESLLGLLAAGAFAPLLAAAQGKAASPAPQTRVKAFAGLPVNLFEYEAHARQRLSQMAYDYVAGGSADEITLRRNRTSFDEIRMKPRVLVDVDKLDTRLQLFGQNLAFPILLAPTAYHKLIHPTGEIGTARGAAAAGATLVVSSFATVGIEDVARAAKGPLWFQLYVQRDRGFTKALVQRAEATGCKALVITVDTPVLGPRDREKRSNFALPPGMQRENLKGLSQEAATSGHVSARETEIYNAVLDPTLTWQGIDWIRSFARTPIILKGILAPEDARLAVEHGAAGIVVSNHGARNLDTAPATIEALPGVVDAVGGRIPVLMDGGVRRGTDLLKALALGAKAVLIGRPYLWGLAVSGDAGVQRVVELLRTEFEAALALCGLTSLRQVSRDVLWPGR
jgi:4-hydroxymandelate oxidase